MQRSRSLAQTRRIAASGDENVPFRIKGNTNKDPFVYISFAANIYLVLFVFLQRGGKLY